MKKILEKIKNFFNLIKLKFFTPPPAPLYIQIPQDTTMNYMENVNKFIDDIFFSVMYDFIFKNKGGEYLNLEPYYSEFLLHFTVYLPENVSDVKIEDWRKLFYKTVTAEVLLKMSPILRENFKRVYSGNATELTDIEDGGLMEYVLKYTEMKINFLVYELTIWRKLRDTSKGLEDSDIGNWGFSSENEHKQKYFKDLRIDSNTELLIPKLENFCDPYKNSFISKMKENKS